MLESLKSALLAALVALSMLLSAQLWFSPAFSFPERLVQAPYTSPDSVALDNWRPLVMPERLYIHLGAGRTRVAGVEIIDHLWSAIAEVGAGISGDDWVSLSDDEAAALRSGRYGHGGAEAVLAARAPLRFWRAVWQEWSPRRAAAANQADTGRPAAQGSVTEGPIFSAGGIGSDLDRVYLFVGRAEIVFMIRRESGYEAVRIDLNQSESSSGEETPREESNVPTQRLRALADGLRTVFDVVADLPEGRTRTLPVEFEGLRLEDGLYSMVDAPRRPIVIVSSSEPDEGALERAFFADLSFVRRIPGREFTIHTDGRSSLTLHHRDLILDYQDPGAMAHLFEGDRLTALKAVVPFVNDRGGWPEGAYLKSMVPLRQRGTLQVGGEGLLEGYRLEFGVRRDGITVAVGSVLTAEWFSGGVAALHRRFYSFSDWNDVPSRSPNPAEAAISILAQVPSGLLPDEARRVKDIRLGYWPVPVGPDEEYLWLVWTFYLYNGRRVWVDAWGIYPRLWIETESSEALLWEQPQ